MGKNGNDKVKIFALIVAILAFSLSIINYVSTRDLQMEFLYLNRLQYAPSLTIEYIDFNHYNYTYVGTDGKVYDKEIIYFEYNISVENIGKTEAFIEKIYLNISFAFEPRYTIYHDCFDAKIRSNRIMNFSGKNSISYDKFYFITNYTSGWDITYPVKIRTDFVVWVDIRYYDPIQKSYMSEEEFFYYNILEKKVGYPYT
jgi:hypothetical protein